MSSIQIINFDAGPQQRRKVKTFPNVLRCGIFGPSGAGKSNILLTILLHIKPYKSLYLVSKTGIKFVRIADVDKLPEPEQIEPDSVIVFDDVLTENQNKIANFFLRGRHRNISCFYLSQTYTKIPKKSGIRENFNYLILFRQDIVNLRQVYNEYVTNLTFENFRNLCAKCWNDGKFGFLTIDVETAKYSNKFVEIK